MKALSEIMSNTSKQQYLESCRARYPSRNKAGKSKMIDEVSDTLGWNRKHTIKALNGQVSLGKAANKRGSKPTYTENVIKPIIYIWRKSEQPCSARLKHTLPLWLPSYEEHFGKLDQEIKRKVLNCSPRQLDRITKPHRVDGSGRLGRKTGRRSHRLKQRIEVRCGPWEVDEPGWMECDTVSHGGGSSSGVFLHTLTMTDIHSGWTDLQCLQGLTAGATQQSVRTIEQRLPYDLLGFDCDNGSEFLNEQLEAYLLDKKRKRSIKWTRSRPYKKNDQAHVEQKNFTHVRQLLGYERYEGLELKNSINELYQNYWLTLRNYFTPVMKLVSKTRQGGKMKKLYDEPATPCDRLLNSPNVAASIKEMLELKRSDLNPIQLAEELEHNLTKIYEQADAIKQEQEAFAESLPGERTGITASVAPSVAIAPYVSTTAEMPEELARIPKTT